MIEQVKTRMELYISEFYLDNKIKVETYQGSKSPYKPVLIYSNVLSQMQASEIVNMADFFEKDQKETLVLNSNITDKWEYKFFNPVQEIKDLITEHQEKNNVLSKDINRIVFTVKEIRSFINCLHITYKADLSYTVSGCVSELRYLTSVISYYSNSENELHRESLINFFARANEQMLLLLSFLGFPFKQVGVILG